LLLLPTLLLPLTSSISPFLFYLHPPPPHPSPLTPHAPLPISLRRRTRTPRTRIPGRVPRDAHRVHRERRLGVGRERARRIRTDRDRASTRLISSHCRTTDPDLCLQRRRHLRREPLQPALCHHH